MRSCGFILWSFILKGLRGLIPVNSRGVALWSFMFRRSLEPNPSEFTGFALWSFFQGSKELGPREFRRVCVLEVSPSASIWPYLGSSGPVYGAPEGSRGLLGAPVLEAAGGPGGSWVLLKVLGGCRGLLGALGCCSWGLLGAAGCSWGLPSALGGSCGSRT